MSLRLLFIVEEKIRHRKRVKEVRKDTVVPKSNAKDQCYIRAVGEWMSIVADDFVRSMYCSINAPFLQCQFPSHPLRSVHSFVRLWDRFISSPAVMTTHAPYSILSLVNKEDMDSSDLTTEDCSAPSILDATERMIAVFNPRTGQVEHYFS